MTRVRKAFYVGWIKSFWLNFHCLPFKQAIRLPILVARRTKIHIGDKGRISIMGGGKLRIGVCDEEFFHHENLLYIDGQLVIKGNGNHLFASGLSLRIYEGAVVEIGDDFACMKNANIQIHKGLHVGKDNMWSWDEVIIDSDTHLIFDSKGKMISHNKDIRFGDHVWLGCRNIVLKGANIPPGCIIAAGSTITSKDKYPEKSIIASKGKVIKENINWNNKLNL